MKKVKKYKIISALSALVFLVFLGWFRIANALFEGLQIDIADMILSTAAKLLWIAGVLFNYVMSYTINFSSTVANVAVVDIGWKIFRDFSNMVFIFILLAISIATILGIQSYNAKTLLKNVILVALLINFSLFATKVVIDAANVFTIGFYNAITENYQDEGDGNKPMDKGISSVFSSALQLHTIYDYDVESKDESEVKNIWTMCAFGSIFLVVTAFVFFAASFLFMKRMVVLMFLMMISPLAFLGMILPFTSGYSRQWWQTLFKESFYAPLYLMFTYIVVTGIHSDEFKGSIGVAGKDNNFVSVIGSAELGGGASFVIFNYILITGLMLASIIIANKLGASGAEGMLKMGKGAQKWGQGKVAGGLGAGTFGAGGRLGRRTVGSWAQKGADKLKDSDYAERGGFGSKLAIKTLGNVGDRSFDVRSTEIGGKMKLGKGLEGGYKTKRGKAQIAETAYMKSLGDPETYARKQAAKAEKRTGKNIFYRMAVPAASGVTHPTYEGEQKAAQQLVAEYDIKRDLKEAQETLAESKNVLRTQKDLLERAKKDGKLKDLTELYANKNQAEDTANSDKQTLEDVKKAYEKIKRQLL